MKKHNRTSSTVFKSVTKEHNIITKINQINIKKNENNHLLNTSVMLYKPKESSIINVLNYNEKQTIRKHSSFYLSRSELMHNKPIYYIPQLIPTTITDRINLFSSIFTDEAFLKHYNETPSITKKSLEEIITHLSNYKGKRGIFDTYAMFFYYICHKVSFDYNDGQYKQFSKTGLSYRNNKPKLDVIEDKQQDGNDVGSVDEELDNEDDKWKRTSKEILESGVGTQEEYCKLFEYFCKICHLKVKRIIGNCKYYPKIKTIKESHHNHSWNIIEIRNKWHFIDLTLGAGAYNPQKSNRGGAFNPYYFLTPSEYLINSHFPKEINWQLLPKTMTYQQYQKKMNFNLGDFYGQVYHHQIQSLTHNHPYIKANTLEISIGLQIKESILRANLFSLKDNTKLSEIKYSYNEAKSIFTFSPIFPGNGNYILQIIGRSISSTDLLYVPYLKYTIQLNIDPEIKAIANLVRHRSKTSLSRLLQKRTNSSGNPIQPKVISEYHPLIENKKKGKICMDNSSAYLFEPKSSILKRGTEIKFKVKIKNALAVALLDGRKWNFMKKREEDIWEGVFAVQTDKPSICSLKTCNVYTEVFEFKTVKV